MRWIDGYIHYLKVAASVSHYATHADSEIILAIKRDGEQAIRQPTLCCLAAPRAQTTVFTQTKIAVYGRSSPAQAYLDISSSDLKRAACHFIQR